jgi:tRNA(Ile)-lysidine synthase
MAEAKKQRPEKNLERRVAEVLARHVLFDERSYVVAVSGGPDSTALALVLKACAERGILKGRMHIAHLNHRLRGRAAGADAAFVRRLAKRLGAEFHLGEQDIRALAARRRVGIEEAGRAARYEFLEQVARRVGARRIALGHTATDNAETVLQRILRGTGLTGLAGIPLRRVVGREGRIEIVRPLLFTTREQILAYLRERKARHRLDATNVSLGHFRNRVRHELMPLLEARYNRQVQQALLRLARIAAVEHGFVTGEVERWVRRARPRQKKDRLVIELKAWHRMPEALLPLVVRKLLVLAGAGLQAMSIEHYEGVAELVRRRAAGRELQLPGGFSVQLSRAQLIIARRPPTQAEAMGDCILAIPGEAQLPGDRVIRAEIVEGRLRFLKGFLATKTPWEEMLDADKVVPPVGIRGLRPGDRFHPLGAPGRKKVADFLADAGTPRSERKDVLIVYDHNGPVWVAGMRMDERAKITRTTRRVLRLAVQTAMTSNQ